MSYTALDAAADAAQYMETLSENFTFDINSNEEDMRCTSQMRSIVKTARLLAYAEAVLHEKLCDRKRPVSPPSSSNSSETKVLTSFNAGSDVAALVQNLPMELPSTGSN